MLLVYGLCRCVGHIFLFKNESLDAHVNTRRAAYNGVRGYRGPTAQTAPHKRRQSPPQYLGGRVDLLDPVRVARLRLLLCAPAIAEDERRDEPEEADRAAEQNNGVTLHVCADRPHERCGDTRRKTRGEKKRAVSRVGRGDFAASTASGGGAYVVSRVLRRPCCCGCVALSHVAA